MSKVIVDGRSVKVVSNLLARILTSNKVMPIPHPRALDALRATHSTHIGIEMKIYTLTTTKLMIFVATLFSVMLSHPTSAQSASKGGMPTVSIGGTYTGEIRAFASQECPKEWFPTKGQELDATLKQHKKLFATIGTLWGSTAVGKFKLPNLEGQFLRGWNQGRTTENGGDPDATERTIPPGAPIDPKIKGDQVGTSQSDSFANHSHTTDASSRWGDKSGDARGWAADNGTLANVSIATSPIGGKETRPKNVSVLFCIKS